MSVKTVHDAKGWKLLADDQEFSVKGVVWAPTPIGQNYSYNLWNEPDAYLQKLIDLDMPLIKAMGGNAIRMFATDSQGYYNVPPKWVEYIYDRYGIFTIVNDQFGRYGVTVRGLWQSPTDYSDPDTRKIILEHTKVTLEKFKNTRGVLAYMFGNESNYGLSWTSNATQDLPAEERDGFRAKAMYSLFEEGIQLAHQIDPNRPAGLINGDLGYLEIIKAEVPSLDILGVNTYRGAQSFNAFYQSIARTLDKPFFYTELGSDAYNVATETEDQDNQAKLIKSQWREIYDQAYGKGKSANALGGVVFEWVDEWWKSAGMETNLSVHDTEATWTNGGYTFDNIPGKKNMNEEWFGIVGLSQHSDNGIARRLPRTAYWVLQDLWKLDLYASTKDEIAKAFAANSLAEASVRGNTLALRDGTTDPHPTMTPHGSVTVRTDAKGDDQTWDAKKVSGLGVVTQATVLAGLEIKPADGLTGSFLLRVLPPKVNNDPAKDLFDPLESATKLNTNSVVPTNQVELYKATIDYQSPDLTATFHYHDGHPDWVAEGDWFGMVPESFDLFGPDHGGLKPPVGLEVTLPTLMPGLKLWGGPEIYWGAQPQVVAKYYRRFDNLAIGVLHQEEFGTKSDASSSGDRTADHSTSVAFDLKLLPLMELQAGAMLGRYNRVGQADHVYSSYDNGALSIDQQFTLGDALAAKVRFGTPEYPDGLPYVRAYLQYLYAGPLAETREAIPREGSQLADIGTGNRSEFIALLAGQYGDFNLRTEFLYRAPLKDALDVATAGAVRDPLTSEFFVYKNRKAIQGEAVFTWDREGSTYFHDWNNVDRESSPLSASLGLLYNFYLGPTDAGFYYNGDGLMQKLATGLPEVTGTWSLQAKANGQPVPGVRVALTGSAGRLQSSGQDTRLVEFWKAGGQVALGRVVVDGSYASNAWGAADWYRTFNLTYPVQWNVGLAYGLKPVSFLTDSDRVGVRLAYRELGTYGTAEENASGLKSRFAVELFAGLSY